MQRVLLVSEEIAGYGGSGGIGAAFEELAITLANQGFIVDFLLASINTGDEEAQRRLSANLARSGVRFLSVDWQAYAWNGLEYEKKAYSLYRHIVASEIEYDVIHFHDYKGLGFFCLAAQRQGLAFAGTAIVVQLHGPTRWTIEANSLLFCHPDQLRIDFMERECIRWANHLVSPSAYLIDWLRDRDFALPEPSRIHVIKNVCSLASRFAASFRNTLTDRPANEIVYFARHEDRKGFEAFCDAIDLIRDDLSARNVTVTLLGKLGEINGRPSGVELTHRAKNWDMPLKIRTQLDRYGAVQYLAGNDRSIVVIPSPCENSPYTVVEAAVLGKPVVTSTEGGAKELIASDLHDRLLARIEPVSLAERLMEGVTVGLPRTRLAESPAEIEKLWGSFHMGLSRRGAHTLAPCHAQPLQSPKVVFGITHFERPQKLAECLLTAMRQDYENIEIVVVDDGSTSEEARAGLRDVEHVLKRIGGRLIRQTNAYLGAARNAIAHATKSDYLLFLDDDDLAFRCLTSTLVKAAVQTGADVVGCFNIFMEEQHRAGCASSPETYRGKLSYAPLGGPLSTAPFENWLGAATALIRRLHFERIGGYTELQKVGHEDYEFFLRSLQAGARLEIVPEPLYLYEVGRPSMVSRTSMFKNYKRVVDSLDLGQNQDAWRDLIAMNTGRKVIEDRANRIDWEYRTSAHPEHLLRLREQRSLSPADYAATLANYAASVGAPRVARAWGESMITEKAPPLEAVDTLGIQPSNSAAQTLPLHGTSLTSADLLIAADLKLGRQDEAVNALIEQITRAQVIDRSLADLIRVLAAFQTLAISPAIDRLLEVAGSVKVRKDYAKIVGVSLAMIELRVKRFPGERSALSRQYEFDEIEYTTTYPDVADAIVSGEFTCGLQHYERHGFMEQRVGYGRLQSICDALNRTSRLDIKPWTLSDALDLEIAAAA